MTSPFTSLHLREYDDFKQRQRSGIEKLPVIGCLLYCFRQYNRSFRLRKKVADLLGERDHFPFASWSSAGCDTELAATIAAKLSSLENWPNSFFMPDDPLGILLLDPSGLEFVVVHTVVHSVLGRDIDIPEKVIRGTIQEFVLHIQGAKKGIVEDIGAGVDSDRAG